MIRHSLRNKLKGIKKVIDEEDKAKKAAVAGEVVKTTVALLEANPNLPYLVYNLEALANNKAIDGALKQVKALAPEIATLFVSADPDGGKVLAMAYCPKSAIEKGLKANEWCGSLQSLIGGKGGGKPDNAQASGANVANLTKALQAGESFAQTKLGVGPVTVVDPTVTSASTGKSTSQSSSVKTPKSSDKAKPVTTTTPSVTTTTTPCISGIPGSPGVLLVQCTAQYCGQGTCEVRQSSTFQLTTSGPRPVSLTDPGAAALYLARTGGKGGMA